MPEVRDHAPRDLVQIVIDAVGRRRAAREAVQGSDVSERALDVTERLKVEIRDQGDRLVELGTAEAKARWIPAAPPGWQLDFRAGDASRTDRMKQLPPFDFIFIRHQNYWHDPAVWEQLYRNALGALKPGGLLAITSYFDREHDLATACLLQCGALRRADLPHPHSRPLPDAPGKSVDRRLALFSAG
jgi:SAM-dependent methyltransferase